MSNFFDQLLESVQQMNEITRGERAAAREFTVNGADVKRMRTATSCPDARTDPEAHSDAPDADAPLTPPG